MGLNNPRFITTIPSKHLQSKPLIYRQNQILNISAVKRQLSVSVSNKPNFISYNFEKHRANLCVFRWVWKNERKISSIVSVNCVARWRLFWGYFCQDILKQLWQWWLEFRTIYAQAVKRRNRHKLNGSK